MAGFWTLYKPEATQNYIPNPSFEDNAAAGYSEYTSGTASGTLTRGATWQKRGYYGYRLVKSGGGASDKYGVEVAANSPTEFTTGESATLSVDLNVAASTTVTIEIEATVGGSPESTTLAVAASSVGRYSVTHTLSGNATAITARVYIDSTTGTVDIDGLQVENKAYATSYCDGDQDGCKWLGERHASSSTRDSRAGFGGRAYNLDDLGFYIEMPTGFGMPPQRHQTQLQAQLPGALYRGTTTDPRVIVLSGSVIGSSHANTHSLRKELIEFLKEDATSGDPIVLEYTGANSSTPVRVVVRYDTGLDGSAFHGFTDQIALRLIAYDPFWVTDGNRAASLTGQDSALTTPYLARRTASGWQAVVASLNGAVRAVVEDADGAIYFAGDFTNAGSVAAADYIAKYDPEDDTVTALGTGMNGLVRVLVAHPNGNLYAGGDFTSAGGISDTSYLARWTGSGWQSMTSAGNGFDGVVRALAFDADGALYIGGDFANANGSAYAGIVKSTLGAPQNFTAMGSGTAGGNVYALAVTTDGTVYAGGTFTGMGGVSNTAKIAAWGGSAWTALGTGANGAVYALLGSSDGMLMIGGAFTQLNGTAHNYIVKWNGLVFSALSTGMDADVLALFQASDGLIYVGGSFTDAGVLDAGKIPYWVMWDGARFLYPDGGPTATVTGVNALLVASNGDLYIGSDSNAEVKGAGVTTVTNSGTRSTYPVFSVTNQGASSPLVWIKNETTGSTLYCNYTLVGSGVETLIIDLRPNRRRVYSNYRASAWEAIMPGSDVNDFVLVPGDNVITVRVIDSGTPTVLMQWVEQYWSADGVAT